MERLVHLPSNYHPLPPSQWFLCIQQSVTWSKTVSSAEIDWQTDSQLWEKTKQKKNTLIKCHFSAQRGLCGFICGLLCAFLVPGPLQQAKMAHEIQNTTWNKLTCKFCFVISNVEFIVVTEKRQFLSSSMCRISRFCFRIFFFFFYKWMVNTCIERLVIIFILSYAKSKQLLY